MGAILRHCGPGLATLQVSVPSRTVGLLLKEEAVPPKGRIATWPFLRDPRQRRFAMKYLGLLMLLFAPSAFAFTRERICGSPTTNTPIPIFNSQSRKSGYCSTSKHTARHPGETENGEKPKHRLMVPAASTRLAVRADRIRLRPELFTQKLRGPGPLAPDGAYCFYI